MTFQQLHCQKLQYHHRGFTPMIDPFAASSATLRTEQQQHTQPQIETPEYNTTDTYTHNFPYIHKFKTAPSISPSGRIKCVKNQTAKIMNLSHFKRHYTTRTNQPSPDARMAYNNETAKFISE